MSTINLLPLIPLAIPVILAIFISDTLNARVRKHILRQPSVKIKGVGRYNKEDKWITPVWAIGPGNLEGYRYPSTKIGSVKLNEADKTGYYCGEVTWEWL